MGSNLTINHHPRCGWKTIFLMKHLPKLGELCFTILTRFLGGKRKHKNETTKNVTFGSLGKAFLLRFSIYESWSFRTAAGIAGCSNVAGLVTIAGVRYMYTIQYFNTHPEAMQGHNYPTINDPSAACDLHHLHHQHHLHDFIMSSSSSSSSTTSSTSCWDGTPRYMYIFRDGPHKLHILYHHNYSRCIYSFSYI